MKHTISTRIPIALRAVLLLLLSTTVSAQVSTRPDAPAKTVGEESRHVSDVTDLELEKLFSPIGRRGPEFAESARGLDGRRVRIRGYMVRRDAAPPGTLLLTPYPVALHDEEFGLADDLPAATVWVVAEGRTDEIAWMPGVLQVTGRLELGARLELDGRNSAVRLFVDAEPAGAAPSVSQNASGE